MSESEPVVTDHKQDPLSGTYIDERYRIESLLGKGGSAAVYKAFDEKVGRMVAIKLPKSSGAFAGMDFFLCSSLSSSSCCFRFSM